MPRKHKNKKKTKLLKTSGAGVASFAEPKAPVSEEIATRQTAESFFSMLRFLPNPDPVLRKQGKSVEVYRELRSDAKVQAVLGSRKAGVKKFRANIEENGASPELLKLIEGLLSDNWDLYSLIDEILEASEFGYKPFELLWEFDGKFWAPTAFPGDSKGKPIESESRGLIGKPPEWFKYSGDNRLLFMSRENYQGIEIPDKKFVIARRKPTYSNPYGEAILAAVFWPVIFKKNGLKFWNLFVEKYGSPFLVGKYPRGAQAGEVDGLLDSLEDMIQDAVAAIPEGSAVDLIERSGSGSGNQEFKSLADFMDKQISQAILGQNLTSDVSGGSLAAAEVHDSVKEEIIADDAKIVERFFADVFKYIRDVNFPGTRAPRLKLVSPKGTDKELADRDKTLSEIGVEFKKEYFVRNHGIEEDHFEIKSNGDSSSAATPGEFAEASQKVEEESEFEDQNAVDHFIDSFKAGDLQSFADELLAPIFRIVGESKDFSECMERLSEAYPEMSSEKLEDTLSQAIFVSESFGEKTTE